MREMTASEVSRNFSRVLDAAEHGETVLVTRSGKSLAIIAPAPRANGAAVRAVMRRWADRDVIDDEFVENVEAARTAVSVELDTDPWHD